MRLFYDSPWDCKTVKLSIVGRFELLSMLRSNLIEIYHAR